MNAAFIGDDSVGSQQFLNKVSINQLQQQNSIKAWLRLAKITSFNEIPRSTAAAATQAYIGKPIAETIKRI